MKGLISLAAFLSFSAIADATCHGKIQSIYKWDTAERISVLMDNPNARWIMMPTISDESMALMAFAANKSVKFRWVTADVISCQNGWTNNRVFKGWWLVESGN